MSALASESAPTGWVAVGGAVSFFRCWRTVCRVGSWSHARSLAEADCALVAVVGPLCPGCVRRVARSPLSPPLRASAAAGDG